MSSVMKPIKTAPKDGTTILGYVEKWSPIPFAIEYLDKEYFKENYDDANYMDEGWYYSMANCFGCEVDRMVFPTHWMPLPTPPEGGE